MTGHCQRCEELKAEIAYLRSELNRDTNAVLLGILRSVFRLRPSWARIVLILYNRGGRCVSQHYLEDSLPHAHGHERESTKTIAVAIHGIRGVLGEKSIETIRGEGYALTSQGRAVIEPFLKPRIAAE